MRTVITKTARVGRTYSREASSRAALPPTIALLLLCGVVAGAQESTTRLRGSISPAVTHATPIGAVDRAEDISFTVALPLRNRTELEALLKNLYTPGHPLYHRFLNTGEFAARFCPSENDYQSVIAFARQSGLRVRNTHASRTLLEVAAPAGVVEHTFGIRLLRFQSADGETFRAPDVAPSIPSSIAPRIAGILGLDNAAHRRSFDCFGSDLKYGMTPSDIKQAYSLDGLALDGTGQTLAIASLDDFAESDITAYENCFGLRHVPLQRIPVYGGANGNVGECTLDIEMAVAMAPGLDRILVYHTFNGGSRGLLAQVALDNAASQVSISWGARESAVAQDELDFENMALMWMAAQGQSVYAASGDNGTGYVNSPASQPYVVGVGGTTLYFGREGGYADETVWEMDTGGGGTGGVSGVWPLPAYQSSFVSPQSNGSATHRNVPDVSLNADPTTGYAYYFRNQWQRPVGGTSAAAPLWAAFNALANQGRAMNGRGPLGFPNPAFYYLYHTSRYKEDFHDIFDSNRIRRFPAVPGYDNVTGLGTLNGTNLLADLQFDAAAFHVDGNFTGTPENGTTTNPFKTVGAAVQAAAINRATLIYIKGNAYRENLAINKNVLLVNDGGGPVMIGN
jgi:subtilase family serine protease